MCICADRYYKHLTMPIVSPCRLRSKGAYDGHSNKRSISYLTNAVYIIGATQYIYCPFLKSLVTKLTTFLVGSVSLSVSGAGLSESLDVQI